MLITKGSNVIILVGMGFGFVVPVSFYGVIFKDDY